jgi:hypothetical protein
LFEICQDIIISKMENVHVAIIGNIINLFIAQYIL